MLYDNDKNAAISDIAFGHGFLAGWNAGCDYTNGWPSKLRHGSPDIARHMIQEGKAVLKRVLAAEKRQSAEPSFLDFYEDNGK